MHIKSIKISNQTLGACFKTASCCSFAGVQAIVRYLSNTHTYPLPINVILFYQSLFALILLMPYLIINSNLENLKTNYVKLHFFRIICALVGISLFYLTLKYFPLAQSAALNFLSPMVALIFAHYFLKEKINFALLCCIILSFLGAALVLYPELKRLQHLNITWIVILPIVAAIALSASKLLTRKLGALGENPSTITFYLLFFSVPICYLFCLFDNIVPTTIHMPWLIAIGVLTVLGHILFSYAYTKAGVAYLTPYGYTKLIFSLCFGALLFQEVPNNPTSIIGLIIILSSALLINFFKK